MRQEKAKPFGFEHLLPVLETCTSHFIILLVWRKESTKAKF